MTIVIDMYGGPGTGKSTSAAYVYHQLKIGGYNVELVREYVKDWAWEQRSIGKFDQLYFLGKQSRKESMLYGKVDYIVTDSPILMNMYYALRMTPPRFCQGIIQAVYSYYWMSTQEGHKHIHVHLTRTKPYSNAGRWQNEAEAKAMDKDIETVMSTARQDVECFGKDLWMQSSTDAHELDSIIKRALANY
jgi:hypothetical protein